MTFNTDNNDPRAAARLAGVQTARRVTVCPDFTRGNTDASWMAEWCGMGIGELAAYLEAWDAFLAWCAEHRRP